MIEGIEQFKIAVIGGGLRCKTLLEAILSEDDPQKRPEILGVADKNGQAAGLQYAQSRGIFTTSDFRELFMLDDVGLILELTPDDSLREVVREAKPPWVLFVDHYEARSILDHFQIKAKKGEILKKLGSAQGDAQRTAALFEEFYDFVLSINNAANTYARETRDSLVASELTLSQIINGSTIPTFVINKEHKVTHWNKACEKLTGFAAKDMLSTDNQWKPFRSEKRPTIADLILDRVKEEDLWRLYSARWERSALIDGGYEVEEFFPHLGQKGTWLFFTAVPIRTPDGSVVGAIETLWDRTERKRVEEEREQQNKELAQKVEELSDKEQMMSQIINGSTIPTFVIDKTHRITHWNKALELLTGYAAGDMVGTDHQWKPFYDQERPSMADVILDQIEASHIRTLYGSKWRPSALLEGAYEAEIFFPHLGESGKWCWFTAAPIRTPDGEVVGAIETIWDKTEDRLGEKEREQHTRELATFCSIYATLSGSLSLEGRIRDAIDEVASIFMIDGISIYIRQTDGRFHLRYNHGFSDRMCFNCRIAGSDSLVARVAHGGKTVIMEELDDFTEDEMKILKQEGLESLVHIPILGRDKHTFGIVRVGSRIAGHFKANEVRALELIANRIGVAIENAMLQDDVHRRANFQAKLIRSSNDGIVATDDKGQVVIFNPAAESIFGYSATEVIGKLGIKTIFPADIISAFDAMMTSGISEWSLPWQDASVTSKNGDTIPVRFSSTILRSKNRVMGSVAFFHDLREIKRLQKELVNAERLAAVGQTVAGMAHCVKNILHGLKGGSYMVNVGIAKDNQEKLKSGWNMVQRNIVRTSDLVQDLLSYSKEREPEYQVCAPNDIVEELCELMQEVAREHGVTIEKQLDPALGRGLMDPRSLHRSLLNLVSNAIDACRDDPSAGKQHRVTVTTAREGREAVRFEVRDNGSGMSDEVKHKLFSSFFSTKGAKGTGLGLLVTSKLIEENKGRIEVDSQLGEGTAFKLHLPFKKEN